MTMPKSDQARLMLGGAMIRGHKVGALGSAEFDYRTREVRACAKCGRSRQVKPSRPEQTCMSCRKPQRTPKCLIGTCQELAVRDNAFCDAHYEAHAGLTGGAWVRNSRGVKVWLEGALR